MIQQQRVLFSDDGTLTDWSLPLNNFRDDSKVMAYVASEDYLYIGSEWPFNHRYFDVSVANDQASIASVEYWDGNEWVEMVDILDRTAVGGVSLAQSGIIQWTPDIDETSWAREQESEDITGLSGTKIYDFWWVRLKWSVTLANTTALNYIGHKFAEDSELFDHYPDLRHSNLMVAFEAGKADWNEQHFSAAEMLLDDLRRRSIIVSPSQVLDYELFRKPAIHKVAELIYTGLQYYDAQERADKRYEKSMAKKYWNIDVDGNARVTESEKTISSSYLTR